MPSPLAHSIAGFVVYRWSQRRLSKRGQLKVEDPAEASAPSAAVQRWPALSKIAGIFGLVCLSLLPDFDVIAAVFYRDMTGFHNQGWHSLLVGCAVAPLVGLIFGGRRRWRHWTLLTWACFELHVLMDAFSMGRGVMLMWPLSSQRFVPPFYFFHGVRWAEGWWAWDHLFTLINELGWLALVILLWRFRAPERRL